MIPYATVITHIFSLFPISVCFYIYKYNFEQEALFLFFNLIFATLFSTFYHTYDYDSIKLNVSSYSQWAFLDHFSAATLIIVTALYTLRFRSSELYLLAYIFKGVVICCYMLVDPIFNYWIYVIISFLFIYKFKIVLESFKKQCILCFISITTASLAIFSYYTALTYYNYYKLFHSLWHCFIFTTSGLLCILKYKMNKYFIRETDYNRTRVDSV